MIADHDSVQKEDRIRSNDRFMPCVLARLTDGNPQAKTEHYSRAVTIKQLKRDIMWNIELILNSRSRPSDLELHSDPDLLCSVVGLGLSDFCGRAHDADTITRIEQNIVQQLKWFEPRLVPESLSVHVLPPNSASFSVFQVEIQGQIEAEPLHGEILFISMMDLESGTATINFMDEK